MCFRSINRLLQLVLSIQRYIPTCFLSWLFSLVVFSLVRVWPLLWVLGGVFLLFVSFYTEASEGVYWFNWLILCVMLWERALSGATLCRTSFVTLSSLQRMENLKWKSGPVLVLQEMRAVWRMSFSKGNNEMDLTSESLFLKCLFLKNVDVTVQVENFLFCLKLLFYFSISSPSLIWLWNPRKIVLAIISYSTSVIASNNISLFYLATIYSMELDHQEDSEAVLNYFIHFK